MLTSPKKLTNEFVLYAFLLFTANKSNSSVHFLVESTARQSAFRFYLTFMSSFYTKLIFWTFFANKITVCCPVLCYPVVIVHFDIFNLDCKTWSIKGCVIYLPIVPLNKFIKVLKRHLFGVDEVSCCKNLSHIGILNRILMIFSSKSVG